MRYDYHPGKCCLMATIWTVTLPVWFPIWLSYCACVKLPRATKPMRTKIKQRLNRPSKLRHRRKFNLSQTALDRTSESSSALLQLPYPIRRDILEYILSGHVIQLEPDYTRRRFAMKHSSYPSNWEKNKRIRTSYDSTSQTFECEAAGRYRVPLGAQRKNHMRPQHAIDDKVPDSTYLGDCKFEKDFPALALLMTCRQLYQEGIDLLYTTNTFSFCRVSDLCLFPRTLLSQRLASIRYLHILVAIFDEAFFHTTDTLEAWTYGVNLIANEMKGLRQLDIELPIVSYNVNIIIESWLAPLNQLRSLEAITLNVYPVGLGGRIGPRFFRETRETIKQAQEKLKTTAIRQLETGDTNTLKATNVGSDDHA